MPISESPTLVVGEALADILIGPDGARRSVPGGSPANVAVGMARLGHPVQLATRVGRDAYGRTLRQHLGASGVELTEGSVVDGATSTATAYLDSDGTARYRFAIDWQLPPGATELACGGGIAHLHTGSIATTLAPGATRVRAAVAAARARATVSYDPNLRPVVLGDRAAERARVLELVCAADLVKASEEDLDWLHPGEDTQAAAARWARMGPALVVLTQGARGARAFWRRGSQAVPSAPVTVVDTVGAGDAFMSGLISGLLRAGLLGEVRSERAGARAELRAATGGARLAPEVLAALALANRAAAVTCGREGADPPTRAELLG